MGRVCGFTEFAKVNFPYHIQSFLCIILPTISRVPNLKDTCRAYVPKAVQEGAWQEGPLTENIDLDRRVPSLEDTWEILTEGGPVPLYQYLVSVPFC